MFHQGAIIITNITIIATPTSLAPLLSAINQNDEYKTRKEGEWNVPCTFEKEAFLLGYLLFFL